MAEVIVFDVVGTLLDLSSLDSHFERAFGFTQVRQEWFHTIEQLMFVSVAIDSYMDFNKLAKAALQMMEEKQGVELSVADRSAIQERMETLSPFPDVADGLRFLRDKGLRLAALTNGTLQSARTQLRNASLTDFFDEIMSVDEVGQFKPGSKPYEMAANRLGVEADEICMVAAHWWDIAGASRAEYITAFIARPEEVINPAMPKPKIIGNNLIEVANKIVQKNKSVLGL